MDVIRVGVADGLGEHMFVGHGNVVFGEVPGFAPGIPAAGDHRLEAAAHGPFGRGSDGPRFIGVDPQRALLADHGQHGLPGRDDPEPVTGGLLGLRVGGRFGEEGVDLPQFPVAISDLIFEGRAALLAGGTGRRIQSETGPVEVEGDLLLDGEILDGPAVELDQTAESGDGAPGGDHVRVGIAVGPRHRDQFAVRVDGDPGADIGRVVAHLGGVAGGPQGVDLEQAQHRGRGDQTGKDPLAFQFDDSVGGVGEAGADLFDAAIADEDRGVGLDRAGSGEDPSLFQQQRCGLGCQQTGDQSDGENQGVHAGISGSRGRVRRFRRHRDTSAGRCG